MIKFVIFDMDDVLYDYDHNHRLNALSELTGFKPDDIDTKLWGGPHETRAEAGCPATGKQYLEQYQSLLGYPVSRAQFVIMRRNMMRPRANMLALAAMLKSTCKVALLTNNGMLLKEELFTIAPALRPIFGSSSHISAEFGLRKPDPELYLALCKQYDFDPAETLFVDDKLENIEGAQTAGLNGHHFIGENAFLSCLKFHNLPCKTSDTTKGSN